MLGYPVHCSPMLFMYRVMGGIILFLRDSYKYIDIV